MTGWKMFGHIKFATETQDISTGHTEQGKMDSSSRDESLVLIMLSKNTPLFIEFHLLLQELELLWTVPDVF